MRKSSQFIVFRLTAVRREQERDEKKKSDNFIYIGHEKKIKFQYYFLFFVHN